MHTVGIQLLSVAVAVAMNNLSAWYLSISENHHVRTRCYLCGGLFSFQQWHDGVCGAVNCCSEDDWPVILDRYINKHNVWFTEYQLHTEISGWLPTDTEQGG